MSLTKPTRDAHVSVEVSNQCRFEEDKHDIYHQTHLKHLENEVLDVVTTVTSLKNTCVVKR
jgi:hypothetical protein